MDCLSSSSMPFVGLSKNWQFNCFIMGQWIFKFSFNYRRRKRTLAETFIYPMLTPPIASHGLVVLYQRALSSHGTTDNTIRNIFYFIWLSWFFKFTLIAVMTGTLFFYISTWDFLPEALLIFSRTRGSMCLIFMCL